MALSTQPYKGARDFYPEDKRLQKYMFGVIRNVVESFGYQEYDAPLLEPLELYLAKSSEEIVNEQTYRFEDRGGRKVVIRPEMTPTVSRMVAARRQELSYPTRLYSIPNLWRYERPQVGRLREHYQLNVDIFGIAELTADHEIIMVADSILQSFSAKRNMYEIRLNSRQLMKKRIESAGVKTSVDKAFGVVDAFDKVTEREFVQRLGEHVERPVDLHNYLKNDGATAEIDMLINLLKASGVDNVKFWPSLARGFTYYDDIVFEIFDQHPSNNRSMFGGGRYNGLVGEFGVEPVPTVGFGMGDVTLKNFLEAHNLLPKLYPETDVTALVVGDVYERAQPILSQLRERGINLAVDFSGRKLDAQLKNAVKSGIRYVIFIGEKEIESNEFTLRDLERGDEKKLSLDQVAETLNIWRKA